MRDEIGSSYISHSMAEMRQRQRLCRLRLEESPTVGLGMTIRIEWGGGRWEGKWHLPLKLQRWWWSDHRADLSSPTISLLILRMELTKEFEELLEVKCPRRLVI